MTELRFECTRCGNCCTDKDTLVNVTYNDILKIKNGLDLSLDECLEILGFYVFEKDPVKEELEKMVIPPIKTEKGLAFTGLKKNPSGVCYFYNETEKKCKIYRIRPNFCRTFPFTFRILLKENDKKIIPYYTEKGKQFCPGINESAPVIKHDVWVQLGKKIIEDISDNNTLINKWNDAAKKGNISPTARNFLLTVLNMDELKEKS